MKEKTNKIKTEREHLYKLLNSFPEKDLHAVKSFAEFLNKARKENNISLLQVLENALYEKKELSAETIKNIKKARLEFKQGKTYSLAQVKKELGI